MIGRTLLAASIAAVLSTAAFSQTPTPSATPECDCATEKAGIAHLQSRLTDFGTLARYREDNAKLSPPQKGDKRVIFFGDSITDFWKLDDYFPGKGYINRGISGQSTYHMLLRFRQDVIDLKPKAVVILAGTNDISSTTEKFKLETIKSNFESMADLADTNGVNMVIASVLPVSDYNKWPDGRQHIRTDVRPPEMLVELNVWLKEFCRTRGYVYLDYFTATVDDKGFFRADMSNDGLHPNDKGYKAMAPLAETAIAAALKQKPKR